MKKYGQRITQICRTKWDVIIIDEAHHAAPNLFASLELNSKRKRKTAVLLLTATPFQLSPQEMKGLLSATFAGHNDPAGAAVDLYGNEKFKSYRQSISRYFKQEDESAAKKAAAQRKDVRRLLLPRIVRNKKPANRKYHIVDENGDYSTLQAIPFAMNDTQLEELLRQDKLIRLTDEVSDIYLRERDEISEAASRKANKPFISAALRQLLSSWQQYKTSSFGQDDRRMAPFGIPLFPHPKVQAVSKLVRKLIEKEVSFAAGQRGIGKISIFTTYVGSDGRDYVPGEQKFYGTATKLKKELTTQLEPKDDFASLFPKPDRLVSDRIKKTLLGVLSRNSEGLSAYESDAFKKRFGQILSFSGRGTRPI